MFRISGQVVAFKSAVSLAILLTFTVFPDLIFAQTNHTKIHSFWVAGSSSVTVKADEAVLFMVVRGGAPDATEALSENDRITRQVQQSLEQLGLKGKYRFSANQFNSAGLVVGPALAPVRPYYSRGLQQPACFEVKKYVIVTFNEADLASEAFDQVLAETIDTLTRAGAQQPEIPPQIPRLRFSGPVVFSVKDPGPALREAVRQATEHAKASAQQVATDSGVKLGRILDARVNRPLEVSLPRPQERSIFDELNFQYFGESKDSVIIPATFAAQYSTR
jgi:uncharacterized protein YggE